MDLAASMPDRFAQMRADYAAWASANGVLEMPEGYTADEQINENAFNNVMKPRLLRAAPWAVAVLTLLVGFWFWRRRRRRIVS